MSEDVNYFQVLDSIKMVSNSNRLTFKDEGKLIDQLSKYTGFKCPSSLVLCRKDEEFHKECDMDDYKSDTLEVKEYLVDPTLTLERMHQTAPLFRKKISIACDIYPNDIFPVEEYYFAQWDSSYGLTFVSKDTKRLYIYFKGYDDKFPKISFTYYDNKNLRKDVEKFINTISEYIVDPDEENPDDNKSAKIIMKARSGGLMLCDNPVVPFEIDFESHYNSDIGPLNERMGAWEGYKKDNNRLTILYGPAGTGKTNWIKNYIQNWEGEVIFVPPALAPSISEPDFVSFMKDHTGSLLILEDAEDVMRPRNEGGGTATSNLLNLTDGIMSTFLNLKIIASHNNDKSWIDKALRRKGRCYTEYEFGKLSIDKTQKLCESMGVPFEGEEMTLGDICNYEEDWNPQETTKTIGFN